MAKSIHERVRATLAKAALAEKRAEAKAKAVADAPMYRRMNAQARRDERDDAIIDGSAEPRNARELELQTRAFFGDDMGEYDYCLDLEGRRS